ncbi:MAG: hypothetical protein NTV89_18460 [Proteobacteria bacterium]|nr:hypothetical protein [Pseudomonadota bacterium]
MTIFLFLGLLLLAVLSLVNKQVVLKTVYNPEYFRLPDHVETVITGASDMQFGLNPELIKNSCNIARPAEDYFYVYYKIKFLLNSNNRIKNIITGYNLGGLSKNREDDLYDHQSAQFHKCYFMLLDKYGVDKIYRRNKDFYFFYAKYCFGVPLELRQELSLWSDILFKKASIYQYPFCGRFMNRKGQVARPFRGVYFRNAFLGKDNQLVPKSKIMIEYIEKIAQLCKEKGVNLILISTPVHHSLTERFPSYYLQLGYQTMQKLKEINPQIKYYDFSTYTLSDDCFLDEAHLNSKGNNLFSKEINKLL